MPSNNMSRMTWVLFVGLLWIYPVLGACNKLKDCLTQKTAHVVVADNFSAFISADKYCNHSSVPKLFSANMSCILFVQKKKSRPQTFGEEFPEMEDCNGSSVIHFPKFYIRRKLLLYVMEEMPCNTSGFPDVSYLGLESCSNDTARVPCQITCLDPKTQCKKSSYDASQCTRMNLTNIYRMNITSRDCLNCDNPVKKPDSEVTVVSNFTHTEGGKVNAAQAAGVMKGMSDLANSINGPSAALNVGEGVTGILAKQTDPVVFEEMLFGYASPSDAMNILGDKNVLAQYSRSVRLSKEAFEKAGGLNANVPFGAILRFSNLDTDEMNSTILGNEVVAVEMGAIINNLTDKISIDFKNIKYEGIPSCRSWSGDGSRPNWTEDGCLTIQSGNNVTCQCSHLTFFAILLVPLNESISSSDLNKLTIITQVGCGVSMFFLAIVLFMHFLFRKTNASVSTLILIHLVSAVFLLNLTFLINDVVASLKNPVACTILAALMHYFMLATFTWFAAQAFHLCMLLYVRSTIGNRHYLLKVSIVSWVQPSVITIIMLSLGKYGKQVISTSDPKDDVAICWITDNTAHYIVNIGYYALIFVFTFTTFIIILSYLICLKRTTNQKVATEMSTNKKSITVILGLCCTMGITWGFAFFAYGPLRIPAYYIFTVLNSFQGFFLFIYYHYTSDPRKTIKAQGSTVSQSTLQTCTYSNENPYSNPTLENPGGQTGTEGGEDSQLKVKEYKQVE
nr:adhesion G-protein coupled receptor G6-like isoform X1 [Gasterosteus aculeatus aculeatus]